MAPEVAPDGRRLAFARQLMDGTITHRGEEVGPRSSLWIRDLETGAEVNIVRDNAALNAAGGMAAILRY